MNWTSVKDRLPEPGEYLVQTTTGYITMLSYDNGWYAYDEPKDGYWDRFVTYWKYIN